MMVKRLELTNIRSYSNATVNFSEGKTLFEGDIGSGKSTLLMAVEFALFGLGSETGASILRVGEDRGRVAMLFEADGREYQVVRGLERRGGRVHQTKGSLEARAGKEDLSPSELKERILEVLGFNEAPDPKAQSWIYRYAVYTPQEEMKRILQLDADDRLQVLRRAFKVEDYKVAADNAEGLGREVRDMVKRQDGVAEGLEGLKERLAAGKRAVEEERERVKGAAAKEKEAAELTARLRKETERLRGEEAELRALRKVKAASDEAVTRAGRAAVDAEEELKRAESRVAELRGTIQEDSGPPPTEETPAQLKARAAELEARVAKLAELKGAVEGKLNDYRTILLSGVCPVCDQEIEPTKMGERRDRKEAEMKHMEEEIAGCRSQAAEIRTLQERLGAYEVTAAKAERDRKELGRSTEELERKRRRLEEATTELVTAKKGVEELARKIAPLLESGRKAEEAGRSLELAEKETAKWGEERAAGSAKADSLALQLEETRKDLAAKEKAAAERERLKEYYIWVSDFFVPAVRTIEKNVMVSVNREFDALFQRWFSMLVDDAGKEARIDEEFTPIVSQDGYEQDVHFLSGGEKTSVSLAYRLALNTMVQKVSASMKSNLLILDEPTDGFSKEQLGNVRELLDETGCHQIVLVSHDRELESFADQIFRVEKRNGLSTVVSPTAGEAV